MSKYQSSNNISMQEPIVIEVHKGWSWKGQKTEMQSIACGIDNDWYEMRLKNDRYILYEKHKHDDIMSMLNNGKDFIEVDGDIINRNDVEEIVHPFVALNRDGIWNRHNSRGYLESECKRAVLWSMMLD